MKTRTLLLSALAVVFAPLLLAAVPDGKQGKKGGSVTPPPYAAFVDSVVVNVVSVDVVVTDRKGNRVKGLGREDFELFEDGKRVRISNFYAVEGEAVKFIPAGSSGTGEKPLPAVTLRTEDIPDALQRRFVFYIDNLNLRPFNRNRTLTGLVKFIRETLRAPDEAMVVSYNRSLKIRQPLTAEISDVINVIEGMDVESAAGVQRDSSRRAVVQQINDTDDPVRALGFAKSYARELVNDLDGSIEGIQTVINSLSGLEGKKILFYVSDGLPETPGAEVFHYIQNKFSASSGSVTEMMEFNSGRKLLQVVNAANSQNVAIYPIDAAGLNMASTVDAEYRGNEQGLDMTLARQNETAPLQSFAEETGGKAILNTNDPAAGLARVGLDLATYYSLGYSPIHLGDGRYHPLEVKVKGKGLTVRTRRGYRDKSLETRIEDRLVSLLYFSKEDNALGIDVTLGTPRRGEGENYLIPVEVRIPIKEITLIPDPTGIHKGQARLYFAAMDEDGNRSALAVQAVPFEIPADKLAEALTKYQTFVAELTVRSGRQRVAFAVRDEVSNQTSYVVKQRAVAKR